MSPTLIAPHRVAVALTAAILAAAVAPTARAAGPDGIRVGLVTDEDQLEAVELSFDPARLSTPDGVAALHRAIAIAARHVCAEYLGAAPSADQADCRAHAAGPAEQTIRVMMAERENATEVASAP